tara:strand:+ start:534 stop:971 length:438 start_codon:yes stop_codon:yes gene_type:complete
MAYKGYFKPINSSKYLGNPTNIVYRSRWELRLMSYLDKHPDVIGWASEEHVVPYISPLDRRKHKYYPDFYVKRKINGKIKESLVEVKPKIQTMPPKIQKNSRSRRYLMEVRAWGVNEAKWNAANEYCKDRGWDFKIMTEYELGLK